jgi:hypothetical protein
VAKLIFIPYPLFPPAALTPVSGRTTTTSPTTTSNDAVTTKLSRLRSSRRGLFFDRLNAIAVFLLLHQRPLPLHQTTTDTTTCTTTCCHLLVGPKKVQASVHTADLFRYYDVTFWLCASKNATPRFNFFDAVHDAEIYRQGAECKMGTTRMLFTG